MYFKYKRFKRKKLYKIFTISVIASFLFPSLLPIHAMSDLKVVTEIEEIEPLELQTVHEPLVGERVVGLGSLTSAVVGGVSFLLGSPVAVATVAIGAIAIGAAYASKNKIEENLNAISIAQQMVENPVTKQTIKTSYSADGSLMIISTSTLSCTAMMSNLWKPSLPLPVISSTGSVTAQRDSSSFAIPSRTISNDLAHVSIKAFNSSSGDVDVLELTIDSGYYLKFRNASDHFAYKSSGWPFRLTFYPTYTRLHAGFKSFGPNNTQSSSGATYFDIPVCVTSATPTLSSLFALLGIAVVSEAEMLDYKETYVNDVVPVYSNKNITQSTMTYPSSALGFANPGLTWNGNSWVNENNEEVQPGDMMLPMHDTYNPISNSTSFSPAMDNVIQNPPSSADPDTPNIGEGVSGILGILASILSALLDLPAKILEAIKALIDMILELLQGLFEGVMSLPNLLIDAIQSIIQAITSILTSIWTWCGELPNILADLFQLLVQSLTGLLEWVVEAITSFFSFDWLKQLFEQVIGFFQSILDWLNKLGLFLMSLFIPEVDYIHSLLLSLLNKLTDKIPILNQLKNFFSSIFFTDKTAPPNIMINLPEKYGGVSVPVINFEYFAQHRSLLINFIRLFMWFPFLKRIYQKLPDLIVAK